ncbi:MAG TPA: FAD-linked oxidase C-terminal domain-containing protein [Nitrosomonas sp.]|nr:FAD-linked oxidase C-terminal domain-containing protein [Nitrosomonas sp.]HMW20391.1 FAD-linked oxidase C-terminal domain-containing protein [Nitrosomonas sp.]HMW68175.1 FAD-linked oxidase C-terminal domain-containing protein [Nitrosomonas sp.]HMY60873.1 FAD-linked oxidase C-terminal domain-containing protein [Nitrosomonas sp.]HMY89814.1 FAD-linked oxidase C-terminal domain-containing protein [Nitrosomonas sp.]
MLPSELVAQIQKIIPSERFYTDPVDCYAYGYDNSRKIFPPEAVVFPITTDEVVAIVSLCNRYKIPITPRGRGTGTAGGSIPDQGGIVLSLERMVKILNIDPGNRVVVSEPGVLNQEIQDTVKPYGFFWPPDPSSANFSSIGGNLATSAGGPHAVKYGTTRDHVLGIKAVTATGDIVKTGCYTTKGVVGYDLTRLLIGSEGTLAVITEATLKLTPLPKCKSGLVAYFQDATSCAKAIVAIMSLPQGPSALEFLDKNSLNLIRNRFPELIPIEANTLLIIEVDGSENELSEAMATIKSSCDIDGILSIEHSNNPHDLWKARKALSPLLRDIAPKKINEDIVVPVNSLPQFLDDLDKICTKFQIANVNFGHAGNGNIHVNLLIDPNNSDENLRAEACLDEIFDLVIALKGTLSGEHGIGREKRAFIHKEIDDPTLTIMKSIKTLFDPNNILNPGKIFP